MKKKVGVFLMAGILIASSMVLEPLNYTVSANTDIKNQISDVENKRAEKQAEAKKTEAEINKLEAEMKELNAEIERIDHEVADTNQQLRDKRAEIAEVEENIEKLQEEIAILEERIAERDELLRDRARSMYQNGGSVNYLEVVLGAKSFGDFLDRVNALSVIAQQDRDILDAHIADQLQLEEAKAEVELELAKLEEHLAELEQLMKNLEAQRKEKDQVMGQLEAKEGELHADLVEIGNEDALLRAQEQALKDELAAYEAEQKRKAEEERKAAEAAAKARAAAEKTAASTNTNSSTGSNTSSNATSNSTSTSSNNATPSRNSSTVHSTPAVTNSGFMRPATGTITSRFGPRASFGGRMHYGIDIGKNGRTGDVPIVAVQDGTVARAYYSSSYGNTVILTHYVNGKQITTLYAHLENLGVSTGQRVSKGQTLGMMGNTGRSFGAHLHFEVHEGPWNGAKSNAVDPMKYIPN